MRACHTSPDARKSSATPRQHVTFSSVIGPLLVFQGRPSPADEPGRIPQICPFEQFGRFLAVFGSGRLFLIETLEGLVQA